MDIKAAVCLCLLVNILLTTSAASMKKINHKEKEYSYLGKTKDNGDHNPTATMMDGDRPKQMKPETSTDDTASKWTKSPATSYPFLPDMPEIPAGGDAYTVVYAGDLVNLIEKSYLCHTCNNLREKQHDTDLWHLSAEACAHVCNGYADHVKALFDSMDGGAY